MFCGKCGAQIDTNEKFCGSCGAVVEQQPQNSQRQPGGHNAVTVQPAKKLNNKIIGIISCAVVVLVVIGTISIFSKSKNPEIVVKKYLNATATFDYDVVCKYSACNFDAAIKMASFASLSDDEIKQELLDEYGTTNLKKIYQGPIKKEVDISLVL